MAGLYTRMVDPGFAAPGRSAAGASAGIGAPGAAALPRQQDEDIDAAQMAGLLGLIAKQKEAASAAPGAASAAPGADATPGMAPIGNGGNFDMAPAMAQGAAALPNGGNFAMPPAGSGEAYQLGNVGAQGIGPQGAPLVSNFGAGIPQTAAPAAQGMAMPASIGGAGIPPIAELDPAKLQALAAQFPGMLGMMGAAR